MNKKVVLLLSLFILSFIVYVYVDHPELYRKREKYSVEDRIKQLDNAIIQDEEDSYSYFRRSTLYFKQRKYNRALDDINNAINFIGKYYYLRTNINESLNEMTNALNDIDKAIELDPMNALFYEKRADIKYSRNDIAGSIKDMTYFFDSLFSFVNSIDEDGSVFSDVFKEANEARLNEYPARSKVYTNNLDKLDRKKIPFELYKLGLFYSYRKEKKKLKECIDKIKFNGGDAQLVIDLDKKL